MSPRRLYMDNAATSFPKPRGVVDAMVRFATEIGASAGRGGYAEAVEAGDLIQQCRRRLMMLFNGERSEHFIFTLNCTDALHLAIKGLIDPNAASHGKKPHAICTHLDHNSILRPLTEMQERGWLDQTRVAIDPKTGLVDPYEIRKAIRPETKVIAITHVSNVTGTVQPIRQIGQIAREAAVPFVVDAAQSAGHVPIDVRADCIDLLAAPGHKGLLGPLGTGFLYMRPGMEKILRTVREGGTGSASEEPRQPMFMPDRYESGSHNAIGLIGLSEGLQWIIGQGKIGSENGDERAGESGDAQRGVERLHELDIDLVRTFIDGAANIDGLRYYGPQGVRDRIGVFSVRIEGSEPHELSAILESHYGILTRSGIHCAPLVHAAIGTAQRGGTTRLSFGPFLSKQDVKYATDALAEIAENAIATIPAEDKSLR